MIFQKKESVLHFLKLVSLILQALSKNYQKYFSIYFDSKLWFDCCVLDLFETQGLGFFKMFLSEKALSHNY